MHQTVIKSLCRGDVKWCFIMIMNLEIKLWLLVYYNSRFTLNIIALSNIKSATWGVFCWTIFFFLTSSINISLYPAKFWLGLANNKMKIIFLYKSSKKMGLDISNSSYYLTDQRTHLYHLEYTARLAYEIFIRNVAQILTWNTLP